MKNISKLIWSEEAINNLKEILDYLESKWTERELRNFAKKLERQIDIIKSQPLSYPKSKNKNIRRAVMTKQTTVYYGITKDSIRIVSLFDNRKNPKKLKI
ncbi:MAG: type II toxin-antitoxin system RelE/ParE family toxin [Bacteroidales bacterium]|nr:type II toxin-antitoxin system RelE/ParE family toxin [Bacteroidales bacterium]